MNRETRARIERRIDEIIHSNPMPDCVFNKTVDRMYAEMVEDQEKYIYKCMYNAHIDPDVVKKQALEIERLRKINEELASGMLGIDINEVKRIIREYEYLTSGEVEYESL